MLFWEWSWRREGSREHRNIVEIENGLEMLLKLNFTHITALLRVNGSTKGMVWTALTPFLISHQFSTPKHHKQSYGWTKKQSVCYVNIAPRQMSSSTPIWLFATQLPPFMQIYYKLHIHILYMHIRVPVCVWPEASSPRDRCHQPSVFL